MTARSSPCAFDLGENMTVNWHSAELSELEKMLDTSLEEGLSAKEARSRLQNEIKSNKERKSLFVAAPTPWYTLLFSYLLSPALALTLVLSLVMAAFTDRLAGIVVFVITALAGLLMSFIKLKNTRRLEAMREYAEPTVRVKRSGKVYQTDGRNIVPGDIIYLSAGDILPCDARIIKTNELVVDELYFNGRSVLKRRTEKNDNTCYEELASPDKADNMLFAGTAVNSGSCQAVACACSSDVLLYGRIPDGALGGRAQDCEGVRRMEKGFKYMSLLAAAVLLILSLVGLLTLKDKLGWLAEIMLFSSSVSYLSIEFISLISLHIITERMRQTDSADGKDREYCLRNVKAADAMASVTDLVFIGRSGFTEGGYKINGYFTLDISEKELTPEKSIGESILTKLYLYTKALSKSDIRNELYSSGYADAVTWHLNNCKYDFSGLDVTIQSLEMSRDGKYDFACAESEYKIEKIALSHSDTCLGDCKRVREGDRIRDITDSDKQSILAYRANAAARGEECIYLISADSYTPVFEAIITLSRPYDRNIAQAAAALFEIGIRTTVLLQNEDADSAKLMTDPALKSLFGGKIALASAFKSGGIDIKSGAGNYCAYAGFSAEDYERLIDAMREKGSVVCAYGVDNGCNSVMARANIAASCDIIDYSSKQHRETVYDRLPPEGRDTSVRASSQTRLLSKVTVKRSNSIGGGASALYSAFVNSKKAYLLFAQILVIFVLMALPAAFFAVLSPCFARVWLDPIQTAALASLCAIAAVVTASSFDLDVKKLSRSNSAVEYPLLLLKRSLPSIIASASTVLLSAIALTVLDAIGVFGERAAYSLPIYISLILTAVGEAIRASISSSKRKKGILTVLIFAGVALAIGALGFIPSLSKLYFPYGYGGFEYLLIPAFVIIYAIGAFVATLIEKKRKK